MPLVISILCIIEGPQNLCATCDLHVVGWTFRFESLFGLEIALSLSLSLSPLLMIRFIGNYNAENMICELPHNNHH